MTQTLSTLTPTTGIVPATTRVAALTGRFHNALEAIPGNFRRCALSAAHEPTAEQRQALEVRRDEIDRGLRGCEPAVVKRSIGLLRSVMASQAASEAQLELARNAFVGVLTRFPGWAVEEACRRFLDGRVGSKVYAPTPAEVADLCRTLIAEPLSERSRINAVLDAEVYSVPTAEDRTKVAEVVAKFLAEHAMAPKRSCVPDVRDPQPDVVEPDRDLLKGMKLSAYAVERGVRLEQEVQS